jgi:hypothetical protein
MYYIGCKNDEFITHICEVSVLKCYTDSWCNTSVPSIRHGIFSARINPRCGLISSVERESQNNSLTGGVVQIPEGSFYIDCTKNF